jgi:hypothetical protein
VRDADGAASPLPRQGGGREGVNSAIGDLRPSCQLGKPNSLDRIRHPGLRAAAARFEAETGERLSEQFSLPAEEAQLGVFLIVRGNFHPPSPDRLPPDAPDQG